MNRRAAPRVRPGGRGLQHGGHGPSGVKGEEVYSMERLGDQRVERLARIAPLLEVVAVGPRRLVEPGLIGVPPDQQRPRSSEDAGRALQELAERETGVLRQGARPGRELRHLVATSPLICAEDRQQAGQHDEIHAPTDEPVQLECRVVDYLHRVQPDTVEREERDRGGPHRAAPLPPERGAHDGENEEGKDLAGGAFGQEHERAE